MNIIIAKDYNDMSLKTANLIAAQVTIKPDAVLGLATGSTVLGVYKIIAGRKDLDFSRIKTINVDEYAGLSPSDKQSYRYYMDKNLFAHINIAQENTHFPDGMTAALQDECFNFDVLVNKLGGIDMQLLGLGINGHIGFNEPCDFFIPKTHLVSLEDSTRIANARFFGKINAVPHKAITMGIKTIMQARKIVLCVSGTQKADILKNILYGPVTPKIPGSVLQLHNDVTVIADSHAMEITETNPDISQNATIYYNA